MDLLTPVQAIYIIRLQAQQGWRRQGSTPVAKETDGPSPNGAQGANLTPKKPLYIVSPRDAVGSVHCGRVTASKQGRACQP
jgi:hypothetical protein